VTENRKNNPDGKAFVVTGVGSDSGDCLVVLAGCVSGNEEWILDSACSFHICTNKDWFGSFKPMRKGDVVRMGDDNPCDIVGVDLVQIKAHDGMTRML
jgi:hypothetical protein